MLSLPAQCFERLVDPYPVAGPVQFFAFLGRCADGLRALLLTVTLLMADWARPAEAEADV
jgi:ATP-binding cassette, subfamily B, multidrug efflux pump